MIPHRAIFLCFLFPPPTDLKSDLSGPKLGFPGLKSGLSGLKSGLSDLKSGLLDLKSGLPDLQSDLSGPELGLPDHKSELQYQIQASQTSNQPPWPQIRPPRPSNQAIQSSQAQN